MGIFQRLFSRPASGPPSTSAHEHVFQTPPSRPGTLTELTGTPTFCKDAAAALVRRHGQTHTGYLERAGQAQREPENVADPNAVGIHVDGERIGYLPNPLARHYDLPTGVAESITVQIFAEELPKGLRVEAWAWLGQDTPQWKWSRENRPPLSPEEKALYMHQQRREVVARNVAPDAPYRPATLRGMTRGIHYLELVEPIKQLKREGRLEEALILCHAGIEGAEEDRGQGEPPPWYTEQAAIIYRKLGQREQEVAVLRRWIGKCPSHLQVEHRIVARLNKLMHG